VLAAGEHDQRRGKATMRMSRADEEQAKRLERARAIALFRYGVIQQVIDPRLSTRERGRLVRELAARTHIDPFGEPVQVSRQTIDRWKRWYRTGGFDALVPQPRRVHPRTPPEVLELAAALKRERPERTAAQVQRILRANSGWSPSDRTLQRLFERLGPETDSGTQTPAFGRFEADRPNELWTGDALHGPMVGGRKTYLFCFIDDHSRAVMGARWAFHEDVVRLAAALHPALATRGIPEHLYVDNGSAFVDAWLLRACAELGIKLVHSRPGRPQGRGKIERFFRTVRDQFLVEITERSGPDDDTAGIGTPVEDLGQLNRLFASWVATGYHAATHTETGQPPIERWQQGMHALGDHASEPPDPARLREAFLWSQRRKVTKTATVSLHGNIYQVEPHLAGRQVELVFDPFDLARIEVRHHGHTVGTATPFAIGRHTHPKTRTDTHLDDPAPRNGRAAEQTATGIDYLRILDDTRGRRLARQINYSALLPTDRQDDNQHQVPGQLDLTRYDQQPEDQQPEDQEAR
jgi:putative transposase